METPVTIKVDDQMLAKINSIARGLGMTREDYIMMFLIDAHPDESSIASCTIKAVEEHAGFLRNQVRPNRVPWSDMPETREWKATIERE